MKQTIVVVLKESERPYPLLENHGNQLYFALRQFFEDIGFSVESITQTLVL